MTDPIPRLACAPNFREVVGLQTRMGTIQPGRLYRSDAVLSPVPAEADWLADRRIGLVYDLRSLPERDADAAPYWAGQGAQVHAIDMLANLDPASDPWLSLLDRPDAEGADAMMRALYAGFPHALHARFRFVVEGLIETSAARLVHCTAGKDRTGFCIAILLEGIGVERGAVMRDYMASAGRWNVAARETTRLVMQGRLGRDLADDAINRLMTVHEGYLGASHAMIEREWSGVAGYLASAGVTADHLEQLENVLIS